GIRANSSTPSRTSTYPPHLTPIRRLIKCQSSLRGDAGRASSNPASRGPFATGRRHPMGSASPGTRTPAPRAAAMLAMACMLALMALAPSGATWAAAGLPRFFNYTSPPGVGDDSGEPSIGSNWTREQVFNNSRGPIPNGGSANYFGGFSTYMLNVIFNDCQSPALVTWNQKTLLTA